MKLYEVLKINEKELHPLDLCTKLNQIINNVDIGCNYTEKLNLKIRIKRVK